MIDRDAITHRLKQALEPLPYIYAFWLEGADANGTVDAYSDLDYWVDFNDLYEAEAIQAVEDALESLSATDFKHVTNHAHAKIRQRVYHLKNTSDYLLIDFCWQLHSRPKDEYVYHINDKVEAALVVFDKAGIIQYKPHDTSSYEQYNVARLCEARYRRSQFIRAEKYVHRGLYLEAYAYYNRYVLEPLIDILRLLYTPPYAHYYLIHISQHIPAHARERLEYFAQIASLPDIACKIPQAGAWFDTLVVEYEKSMKERGAARTMPQSSLCQ